MKHLIASLLIVAPALALTSSPAAASSSKKPAATAKAATAKTATKPPAKKTAAKKTTVKKAAVAGAATAGAAAVAAKVLSADEMAIADRVHTGRIACELGQHVNVTRDDKNPGYFHVSGNGFAFHMSPIGTSTGVVRLEDVKAGAVWLQIANKSMLMNQKAGQRLADECMSPEQLQVAEAIKKNPPQSLLESPQGGQ